MAEWSSVVVVAKSLALVCTKDQNKFCFSIWNQNHFFFFQNPQMKKNQKKKKKKKTPKKPKQKLNTFQVIRTNNYPMIFILV